MSDKIKTLLKVWTFTMVVSLLTIMVYHLIPVFGNIAGDVELRSDGLPLPLVSCALLALAVTGIVAWRMRK